MTNYVAAFQELNAIAQRRKEAVDAAKGCFSRLAANNTPEELPDLVDKMITQAATVLTPDAWGVFASQMRRQLGAQPGSINYGQYLLKRAAESKARYG
jgi:hypothetical protein